MNDLEYIGGSWTLLIFSWAVDAQSILDIVATGGTIVLTGMGIANYVIKWSAKRKK